MFQLPTLSPSWFLDGDLPGIKRDTFRAAIETACSRWEAVCGLQFSEAGTASQATLRITVADLGTSGTLADQQLPFRGMSQLRMRVNRRVQWAIFDGRSGNGTDLVRVLSHELGHFGSLQHFDSSPPPELMEPSYSPDIIGPQPAEIKLMVSMYGKPLAPPLPPAGGDVWESRYEAGQLIVKKNGKLCRVTPLA